MSEPLLTIAVPTYNRSESLRALLGTLGPQIAGHDQIELLISDNASPDDTEQVVRDAIAAGLECRYMRNEQNLGADGNFLRCYAESRGRYVWLFSDDDYLFAGAVERVLQILQETEPDLIYIAPAVFFKDPEERIKPDAAAAMRVYSEHGSFFHAVGLRGDLFLISSVIFDRKKVESIEHPSFELALHTNLLQMSWVFSAMKDFRRGVVVDQGLIAVCVHEPVRNFDVIEVFGIKLQRVARTYLSPEMASRFIDEHLYSWYETNWYGIRRRPDLGIITDRTSELRRLYKGRILFWLCAYPFLKWKAPFDTAWLALMRTVRGLDRLRERVMH